jgi:hypothetical protein
MALFLFIIWWWVSLAVLCVLSDVFALRSSRFLYLLTAETAENARIQPAKVAKKESDHCQNLI